MHLTQTKSLCQKICLKIKRACNKVTPSLWLLSMTLLVKQATLRRSSQMMSRESTAWWIKCKSKKLPILQDLSKRLSWMSQTLQCDWQPSQDSRTRLVLLRLRRWIKALTRRLRSMLRHLILILEWFLKRTRVLQSTQGSSTHWI